jgi:hypothetical protein
MKAYTRHQDCRYVVRMRVKGKRQPGDKQRDQIPIELAEGLFLLRVRVLSQEIASRDILAVFGVIKLLDKISVLRVNLWSGHCGLSPRLRWQSDLEEGRATVVGEPNKQGGRPYCPLYPVKMQASPPPLIILLCPRMPM